VFNASFALAQTSQDQKGVGGGGGDTTSSGYQVKAALGDPGVGQSQSANYVYDHGTLWFDNEPTESAQNPVSVPSSGGGDGGNSGSGFFGNLFRGGNDPQIGGVAPDMDVSFTDTPAVAEFVKELPKTKPRAVRAPDASQAIEYAVRHPEPLPQVIRLVDEKGATKEINMVLFKRIYPWPLWIAFCLIVLGAGLLIGFTLVRGAHEYMLWVAGILILIGVLGGIVIRFAYHVSPIDTRVITTIGVVPEAEGKVVVERLMQELPLGVHVVKIVDDAGRASLTVTVFITPALPI
jgi:hypothetical protein